MGSCDKLSFVRRGFIEQDKKTFYIFLFCGGSLVQEFSACIFNLNECVEQFFLTRKNPLKCVDYYVDFVTNTIFLDYVES